MARAQQADLFKKITSAYGGDHLTKRKGRAHGRPVSTRYSMHFVLRSTQARGLWSFYRHRREIRGILEDFAVRFGVRLHSFANVGNHLHIHLQLTNRHTYPAFIRAVSAAIMMKVTGVSRWNKIKSDKKFWDRRPFSRIVVGFKALLRLGDYIAINKLEGWGYRRDQARFYVTWNGISAMDTGQNLYVMGMDQNLYEVGMGQNLYVVGMDQNLCATGMDQNLYGGGTWL